MICFNALNRCPDIAPLRIARNCLNFKFKLQVVGDSNGGRFIFLICIFNFVSVVSSSQEYSGGTL